METGAGHAPSFDQGVPAWEWWRHSSKKDSKSLHQSFFTA
jgi:hypothetical protein